MKGKGGREFKQILKKKLCDGERERDFFRSLFSPPLPSSLSKSIILFDSKVRERERERESGSTKSIIQKNKLWYQLIRKKKTSSLKLIITIAIQRRAAHPLTPFAP